MSQTSPFEVSDHLPSKPISTAVSCSRLPQQHRDPVPFSSHSHRPKKHPPCHHTELTRQPCHNSHCSGDPMKAARPLWQGESSHIKQIISSTHLENCDLKSYDLSWIGCCTFLNHFVLLSVILPTRFQVFGHFFLLLVLSKHVPGWISYKTNGLISVN